MPKLLSLLYVQHSRQFLAARIDVLLFNYSYLEVLFMKKIVFSAAPVLFAALALSTAAQTPPQTTPPVVAPVEAQPVSPCPEIRLQTATQPVREGTPVRFAAVLTGGDTKISPIFNWSISAGVMSAGQGTRNISVDSTGAGAHRQIIADLLIGGFPPECSNQATATVNVAGPAVMVHEFGDLPVKDEAERLDILVSGLSQSPDRTYIFGYAGRTNPRGYSAASLRRMREYIVKAGIPPNRVMVIDGGFREEPVFELWVVPFGSEIPRPTPTVDRREIVFPRTTPIRRKP